MPAKSTIRKETWRKKKLEKRMALYVHKLVAVFDGPSLPVCYWMLSHCFSRHGCDVELLDWQAIFYTTSAFYADLASAASAFFSIQLPQTFSSSLLMTIFSSYAAWLAVTCILLSFIIYLVDLWKGYVLKKNFFEWQNLRWRARCYS